MDSNVFNFLKVIKRAVLAAAIINGVGIFSVAQASGAGTTAATLAHPLSVLPLVFEENQGQLDKDIKFVARGPGVKLFLKSQEVLMLLADSPANNMDNRPVGAQSPKVIGMRFVGSNPLASVKGVGPVEFKTNYFMGTSSSKQFTNIANHSSVQYTGVYPGVDLVYYSADQQLEFDLRLAPHARPDQIKLQFSGTQGISLALNGDLVLATGSDKLINHKPVAYQIVDGKQIPVEAAYVLGKNQEVSFSIGKYNPTLALVIDPIVTFSYPFWGFVVDVAVDNAGNTYVAGSTGFSTSTPTVLPATPAYQTSKAGTEDAFVVKLDATGTKVVYATYIGVRSSSTRGRKISVDLNGNVYLAGVTSGSSFPITAGAYQTTFVTPGETSFLLKLNATGTGLVYSTFLHSDAVAKNGESIQDIAVDKLGNVFITGGALSLVTTTGVFQRNKPSTGNPSPFVARLNATGTAMLYATYLGGNGYDDAKSIAVDIAGNAYVTGRATSPNFPLVNPLSSQTDGVYITKINPTATQLVYSTIVGPGDPGGVAVDPAGQSYVVGTTGTDNFFVTEGVFQPRKGYRGTEATNGFVVKLTATGERVYSSYLGGDFCGCSDLYYSFQDEATHVEADAAGFAYVGGRARSRKFPVVDSVGGTIQPSSSSSGDSWPFVAKVSPLGDRLIYSSLVGARSRKKYLQGMAIDSVGNIVTVGTILGDSAVPDYINSIPMTVGVPVNSSSGLSFIFKLSTGKYPTTVRVPSGAFGASQDLTIVADVTSTKLGGNVNFYDDQIPLGTAPMLNGTAKLTTVLSRGVHPITAIYSEDGVVSPPVFFTVNGQ